MHEHRNRKKWAGVALAALLGCGDAPVPVPALDSAPPGPTADLGATAGEDAVELSWKNPSDADYKLTMVVRYSGAATDGFPTDGKGYAVGDALGSGEVIYVGDGTSFTDTSFDACKDTIYQVWTQDLAGNWCDEPQEATVASGTLVPLPTEAPTGMSAAVGPIEIDLAWTNPAPDTGFTQARVVRKTASAPLGPDDGDVVYTGDASSAADDLSLLAEVTTYHYGVFACNRCGACEGAGDSASVTTPADIPLSVRPTDLTASFQGSNLRLTWMNPSAESEFVEARLVRSLNTPPAGLDDPAATLLYVGPAETAVHLTAELSPDLPPDTPRTYHYTVYGCKAGGLCESLGSSTSVTPTILECLRGGGYSIHWRHASADVCSDNTALGFASAPTVPDWWRSCEASCGAATARQLNAAGLSESAAVGDDFEDLGIPVGRVLSSEFCRNFTTANLMDFGPPVELSQALTYFVYDDVQNRCAASMALIAEVPDQGTNTALIGHAGFSCPVLDSLAWAEAAVFKPDGQGGAELITRVPVGTWLALP